ncbi:STAS domain-containing protein [Metabacillus arenae]|uniref:STAS domain-containing protein n=1 Tax=Metabacillus arenae TaxID=2771434 RepID=A0A926NQM9_9BACI|nr:STAS domain-containing protein [Metabacillus arenae]MBD1382146.1 STAS domain-containing protein [Metabacillus arenae]
METNNPFLSFLQQNRNEVCEEWTERIKELVDTKLLAVISDQMYSNICNEYINLIMNHLENPQEDQTDKVNDFAHKTVQYGWTLKFVSSAIKELSIIIFNRMTEEKSDKEKIELVWEIDRYLSPITNEVIHQYADSWERTVSLQKIALQELSAPLIPVFEHITVMPLVGTIDTERAKGIMENLLQGVVKHRSQVVLIDITGVPVVDTMVAHHIIQAAEAVRLVGAKCLLVGIRPEIAQTIVNLGIDLNQITTKNSLQKGIQTALEMTNRKIVSLEG